MIGCPLGDSLRPDADRLRGDIQRELLALATAEVVGARCRCLTVATAAQMKCPKCGYLGFETTDRCRNCQYDFSLSTVSAEPDLTLRQDHGADSAGDFELPAIKRQTDSLAASPLDLDRLFGEAEPADAAPPAVGGRRSCRTPWPVMRNSPERFMSLASEPEAVTASNEGAGSSAGSPGAADPHALPFDDAPLLPPRAARVPLAVRRATPEIPRNRPRTTRPVRMEAPLAFEPDPAAAALKSSEASTLATETVASLMQRAGAGRACRRRPDRPGPARGHRCGRAVPDPADRRPADDHGRICGRSRWCRSSASSPCWRLATLPSFTVAGGQTIGKMLLKLRVIGDDGRPIDAAGGVLRAVGCMLVPATLGLSYVPALFSSDHRALHDRLAGTRVVSE